MSDLFPPIEPFEHGMLPVGDGHSVYWEACGNPHGRAALFLHGGPGSGCSANDRRWFDPAVYRVVLFDQRGCGRSRPLASDVDADLSSNTTAHLIGDIERLREHLRVDSWVLLGLSWGTTLALAYAQSHPRHVSAIVLGCVTTTSRWAVEWITRGVRPIFPMQWERFANFVPSRLRHLPLCDAYATLLFDADPAARAAAALEWCTWEDAHMSLTPGHQPGGPFEDSEPRLRFARLVTHYWRHFAFMGEDQLLRGASTLNGIPGIMMHGRFDVSSPLQIPWELSQAWSTSRLEVLADAGHGSSASFKKSLLSALREFEGL
jgi:proline iminopeptidase